MPMMEESCFSFSCSMNRVIEGSDVGHTNSGEVSDHPRNEEAGLLSLQSQEGKEVDKEKEDNGEQLQFDQRNLHWFLREAIHKEKSQNCGLIPYLP